MAAEESIEVVHLNVTDLALCERSLDDSLCYPGRVGQPRHTDAYSQPIPLPGELRDYCVALLRCCREFRSEHPTSEDFTVNHGGLGWRVHYDAHVVDGSWFRLRRLPKDAPHFGKSNLPEAVKHSLLHPELQRGGLVLVVGAPGAGKTTTASATVVSRLRKFGGVAYTVENPPELPLNGWHAGEDAIRGYCHQTQIAGNVESGWAESMIGVMRSQPSRTPVMLFVGEIRTAQAAEVALQAAANGFLVIATGFSTDIVSGVDSFLQMVGTRRAPILGQLLRIVVFQVFVGDILQVQMLVSPAREMRVRSIIANGQLARLHDEIQGQANEIRAGKDLWKIG